MIPRRGQGYRAPLSRSRPAASCRAPVTGMVPLRWAPAWAQGQRLPGAGLRAGPEGRRGSAASFRPAANRREEGKAESQSGKGPEEILAPFLGLRLEEEAWQDPPGVKPCGFGLFKGCSEEFTSGKSC